MQARIGWGVIGSGGIARRRTIPEGLMRARNAELRVVYDLDAKANAEVAEQLGGRAASDIDDLLGSPIEVVYVATPADLHCRQVLHCAAAGKHVLCEKPLGLTVTETDAMVAACERANVLLGTAFMMRFHAQHQAALAMIRAGKLGTLAYGRAQLSCWYPPIEGAWRQDLTRGGGGSLTDMGGHCIDLLEMYFGRCVAVSCFTGNIVHSYKPEDAAVALLHFEGGAVATVDTFFCIPDQSSGNVLEIYGSAGSIIARNTIGQGERGEMAAYLEHSAGYDAQQQRAEGGGVHIDPPLVNMYRAEIEEFSQAIIDGREPANNAQLGLQSQKVLSACYESARTGRMIDIA